MKKLFFAAISAVIAVLTVSLLLTVLPAVAEPEADSTTGTYFITTGLDLAETLPVSSEEEAWDMQGTSPSLLPIVTPDP